MKIKNSSIFNQNNIDLNQFKNKQKYQILENYWKKRKKECEINQFLLHTMLISHLNSDYVMSNRPLS